MTLKSECTLIISEFLMFWLSFQLHLVSKFFLSIIWHQDSYWKCQIHLQEYARKKSKIIRATEQNIFYQTQATATLIVKTKSINFTWKLMFIESFEKIVTSFEKIDFLNFFVRYEKIPVTKVLNMFEHFPKKIWCSYDQNWKVQFKKSALPQTLKEILKGLG